MSNRSSAAAEVRRPSVNLTLLLAVISASGGSASLATIMLAPLLIDMAAEFHTSVSMMGQLVTAGAIVWGCSAPLCGMLSDRYGRRPLITIGMIVLGTFVAASSRIDNLAALFMLRMLACVGGAMVTTNTQTIVADSFPSDQRGRALGWVLTGFSLAPVLGVPAVAFVAELGGWRWSHLAVGAAILLLAVALRYVVPQGQVTVSSSYGAVYRDMLRSRAVLALLGTNVGERLTYGCVTTYLAAYLMQTYGLSVGQIAPIMAAVAVGSLLGNAAGGRFAGRASPTLVFAVAQTVAALLLLPLMMTGPGIWSSTALAAAYSFSNAFSRPSFMWMVTQVDPRMRGAMMGLQVMANYSGILMGAAIGGLAIAVFGYRALGLMAALTAVSAVVVCRRFVRFERLATIGRQDK